MGKICAAVAIAIASCRRARIRPRPSCASISSVPKSRHSWTKSRSATPSAAPSSRRCCARPSRSRRSSSSSASPPRRSRRGGSIARVPHRRAHREGVQFWQETSRCARAHRRRARRRARIHRRHHRRRNLVRPHHGPLPRARCAGHARVRLSARAASSSARSSKQFMLLTREESLDPLDGAGLVRRRHGRAAVHALELPPLRGRRHGDGKRDLFADWDDVIASVANYFRENGWETGGPVLAEARCSTRSPRSPLDPATSTLNETVGRSAPRACDSRPRSRRTRRRC